ncbi:MAG TPA: protein translocase subunit SecF [Phycicoccus sp.]|nr:protein translocase subunit SecF [Phycicoccus sp.]
MSLSFAQFGNDLYTGKRSIPVVPRRRAFYLGSGVLIVIAILGLVIQGLNLSLEFKGGSEFRVSGVSNTDNYEARARDASGVAQRGVNVTLIGGSTVRVQTEKLTDTESAQVASALAKEFGVPQENVSATFIGPSWGATVSQKALQALVIFLLLVALVMALYFRTWKMSLAALIALGHDLLVTAGIYAWTGFEVSPATMIGFLTVLGYSLYDTVVVFDKVRENTAEAFANGRMSYAEAANLAVNQTMVRSINTTVVALLPIASVLVVGAFALGPGTLLDLSLVLFIGILVGAYSSIFIATPLLVSLRRREPAVVELARRAERHHAKVARVAAAAASTEDDGEPVAAGAHGGGAAQPAEGATLTGRAVHQYARSGPRNQPRRSPKSKRG